MCLILYLLAGIGVNLLLVDSVTHLWLSHPTEGVPKDHVLYVKLRNLLKDVVLFLYVREHLRSRDLRLNVKDEKINVRNDLPLLGD